MLNVIQLIKCPACKEAVNSFTISGGSGRCPHCNFIFSSARQVVSNTGLRQLKKDRRAYLKNTMTKGQVKTMFKLSKKQISEIPVAVEFGQVRYKKTDVVKAVHTSFERNVVGVTGSKISGIMKKNYMPNPSQLQDTSYHPDLSKAWIPQAEFEKETERLNKENRRYPELLIKFFIGTGQIPSEAHSFTASSPTTITTYKDYKKNMGVECPVCFWKETMEEGGTIVYYKELFDVSCPKCKKMLLVVEYP